MQRVQHHFAPDALQAAWHTRLHALSRSLESEPNSTWAWLWRMRLRVTRFMLLRYGNAAELPPPPLTPRPEAPIETLAGHPSSPLPESPGSFATGRTDADVPMDQLRVRAEAQRRFATFLDKCDRSQISDHVRQHAAEAASRSDCTNRRNQEFIGKTEGLVAIVVIALTVLVAPVPIFYFFFLVPAVVGNDAFSSMAIAYGLMLMLIATVLYIIQRIAVHRAANKTINQPPPTSHGESGERL